MTTDNIVQALKQRLKRIENAIAALEGSRVNAADGIRSAGRGVRSGHRRAKRRMSAAARRRISEAAKARWAKAKKAGRNSL